MNIKDIPHKELSKNESLQWLFIIGGIVLSVVTFASMYSQYKLNQKQLKKLEEKDKLDHPEKG